MSKRASPTVIGAFVVGAIVLAIAGVTIFGSGALFKHTHTYVLYFSGDVNGLRIGAPVKFKGVEVGTVTNVLLNLSSVARLDENPQVARQQALIPVLIELDEDRIQQRGGKIDLDRKDTIQKLIDAGMRAQLATESFVTGLLYVKLDLFPDTPVRLVNDPSVHYQELPTIPTPLEEVKARAGEFLAKLGEMDFAGMVKSIRETIDHLNELTGSPKLKAALDSLDDTIKRLNGVMESFDSTLKSVRGLANSADQKLEPMATNLSSAAANMSKTLEAARDTLASVDQTLEPNSQAAYQLGRALNDVSNAARAIRRLADELERNPSLLLRGRAGEEKK
jgi:phospholipid/cholesterol/gamma-HCH transport system substrate-binding protein